MNHIILLHSSSKIKSNSLKQIPAGPRSHCSAHTQARAWLPLVQMSSQQLHHKGEQDFFGGLILCPFGHRHPSHIPGFLDYALRYNTYFMSTLHNMLVLVHEHRTSSICARAKKEYGKTHLFQCSDGIAKLANILLHNPVSTT